MRIKVKYQQPMKKLTTEEFIKRAREVHGDKYDYSKVEYVNSRTKICIICPKHGEFWITPHSHLTGHGCHKCSCKCVLSAEEFVKRAKEIHGNKYDYSKVEYKNYDTKVCIICSEHGEFWQMPHSHLQGNGCPVCGKLKLREQFQKTNNDFIEQARKVHDNKYDYSKTEYVNANTKVCIICPEHGEFWQSPDNHLHKQGCPLCANINRLLKKSENTETFTIKANSVHNKEYDYSYVKYVNAHTKVCIIHKKCGYMFWQTPNSHLRGSGCPKCSNNLPLNNENIIERFKIIHGDKYNYSKVKYVNNHTKVCVECPIHGEFWQTPNNHLQGQGCPKCKQSKMEEKIRIFLEEEQIDYIYQATKKDLKWLGRQSLDFYLPKYNIAIECQGRQHFEPVDKFGAEREYLKNINRDLMKHDKCMKYKIRLLYFVSEENVKKIINNQKYNNIYNNENIFSDLTNFNEKYLVI